MAATGSSWLVALRRCMAEGQHLVATSHVQAATVTPTGEPSVRTLAFRGFDAVDNESLLFAVDERGDFVADVHHEPRTQICWYFPLSVEQFRLSCSVELIGAQSTSERGAFRTKMWASLSDEQRQPYVGLPPGTRFEGVEGAVMTQVPDAGSPPAHFVLAICRPLAVDHLILPPRPAPEKPRRTLQTLPNAARRFRCVRNSDGSWQTIQINP